MPNLIDLSIPIRHGEGRLGSRVEFETTFSYEDVNWQGSTFCMFCHYGTHVDAPNHFIRGGKGIDQVPLQSLLGSAGVIDLSDHGEATEITGDVLESRGHHVQRDDIAILRTDWTDEHWGTEAFWKNGPYLGSDGADWLVERGVKAVVYDFSEEYAVRTPGFRGEDCLIHHKILGDDIYNIEYVQGLRKITAPRVAILALPLPLVGLDGSPARVVAVEGADLPTEFHIK